MFILKVFTFLFMICWIIPSFATDSYYFVANNTGKNIRVTDGEDTYYLGSTATTPFWSFPTDKINLQVADNSGNPLCNLTLAEDMANNTVVTFESADSQTGCLVSYGIRS